MLPLRRRSRHPCRAALPCDFVSQLENTGRTKRRTLRRASRPRDSRPGTAHPVVMAIRLTESPPDLVVLEFDDDDHERVRAAIRALFGPAQMRWSAVHATVSFGGEAFVYQCEWDDP